MTRFGADDTLDLGKDVLVSAAGRAANADSRKQMREDGAAVLSKAANSKPVTVAKEVFDKLLQSAENQIDMDTVQQRADEYIAKAQAMANDANFRAGFDETPYGPRHAPPASKEDFLSDQQIKELNTKADAAEKKMESRKNVDVSILTKQAGTTSSSNSGTKRVQSMLPMASNNPIPNVFFSENIFPNKQNISHETFALNKQLRKTLMEDERLLRESQYISNELRKKSLVRNRR